MKIDLTKRKILVTGGAGFLGSHIIEKLLSIGVNLSQIVIPRKDQVDLRNLTNCLEIVKDIDIIKSLDNHLSAKKTYLNWTHEIRMKLIISILCLTSNQIM